MPRLPRIEIGFPLPGTSLATFSSKIVSVQVVRASWSDLNHLLRHELLEQASTYVLAGLDPVTGALCLYNGEGGKLPVRLPDHRRNEMLAFAETIFVLTSPAFDKSDVVYLQRRISALIKQAGRACLVQGCGPVCQPIHPLEAEELDIVLAYGLQLLEAAGCTWLAAAPVNEDDAQAA
jgi:hypothetical protein